jgi:hypothetical protein
MLRLAPSFLTWRTLVRHCRLEQAAAIETMVQVIENAGNADESPRSFD